jgi:hypothetical protein
MLAAPARPVGAAQARPVGAVPASHVITFSSDPSGPKPNGWMSDDSAITSLSDSIGADLDLEDYGAQSHGQGLAVKPDDDSTLLMDFRVPVCQLQLSFGDDEPSHTHEGDLARLRATDETGVVAQRAVLLNRDDIMNQRIRVSAPGGFTHAEFWFDVSVLDGLTEVVDRIGITPCR